MALVEQLLAERGLSYCFMDTDSVTAIRPDAMERVEFYRLVEEVVAYFTSLNPFEDGGSLLAYEDQNFASTPPIPTSSRASWSPSTALPRRPSATSNSTSGWFQP